MSGFSLIIRKLFTMNILLWSNLVCILLSSITSANHQKNDLFLPSAVKGKSRIFISSKKSLIFKIIEDLKEEGPVRCFHYVIDSAKFKRFHSTLRFDDLISLQLNILNGSLYSSVSYNPE